jgi:hypothetical protein
MFFGLSAAAFAQAAYSVSASPVTAVINTGLTEKTGDITFTQISGVSALGTLTISYGVPITVPFTGLTITGTGGYTTNASGLPGTPVAGLNVNTTASSNASGILVINVPSGVATTAGTAVPTPVSSFSVSGVRVAVAGTTLTSLSANISATNNTIVAGQTSVVVISSIAPGIASVSTSSSGGGSKATINAATGVITGSAQIGVKEGFLNAFDDINTNTGFGVGLRFTLTAPPPPGVTLTFPLIGTTNGLGTPAFEAVDGSAPTTLLTTAPAFSSSSTSLSVFYRLTSTQDPTTLETAKFAVTVAFSAGSGSVNLPIPAGSIQFNTTLWPTGTAFDANGNVISTQAQIPRYVESLIGPTTLVNISTATTALLVPFAQRLSAIGYDTGFAVANTTEDPGGSALGSGITGAIAQSGTMTFYFFPQLPSPSGTNPTNTSYTTTGTSPGTGLDTSGRLPAGSTYTVLLSQLLQAAGLPADFAGYVIIVTNFTDAHCLFVVSNFTTFSQGNLALVMTGDRTAGAEALNQ